MKPTRILSYVLFFFILTSVSCNKTDNYTSDPLADYFNLAPGKFILYQLDSTLFLNFGQSETVVSYQARDLVDSEFTDNAGRKGWKIIRYLRPLASNQESDWKTNMVYSIVPDVASVEVVEHNLRFIKLKLPVKQGFSWFGNAYLPTNPYSDLYDFNAADVGANNWEYFYDNTEETAIVNGKEYPGTISISQVDESKNLPVNLSDSSIAFQKYSYEQYSRGIGLIYKETLLWEFQPGSGGVQGNRTGFGIRLSILDHN